MPEMRKALEAVNVLNKDNIDEIKTMPNPHDSVVLTMKAVFALMGMKNSDWKDIRAGLASNINFLKDLKAYNINMVSVEAKRRLAQYLSVKEFDPEVIGLKCRSAKSLALWCRAVYKYDDVKRNKIDPKEARVRDLENKYNVAFQALAEQMSVLEGIQGKVRKLQESYNERMDECKRLEDSIELTELRLKRADELKELLADEGKRWE